MEILTDLNKPDAAKALRCSVSTIDRLIESGDLLNTYKMGRRRMIPKSSILDYIKKCKIQSGVLI